VKCRSRTEKQLGEGIKLKGKLLKGRKQRVNRLLTKLGSASKLKPKAPVEISWHEIYGNTVGSRHASFTFPSSSVIRRK
jgi:hypothetical protein